jgi:hypothetical protein
VNDHARAKFMEKHVSKTRMQIKAQKTDPTWEDVIADLFNDKYNVYYSDKYPELHPEFSEKICLALEDTVVESIMPQQVKVHLRGLHAALVVVSSCLGVSLYQ